MKNEKLTQDEYDALSEVKRGIKGERVSACVGRNTKRLAGLKLFTIAKNGRISLSPKGEEVLFLRRCVLAMRALAADPAAAPEADVALFLGKKSHITALPEGGFALSDKGREALADIEQLGI
ncbi:hypothetical protein [Duganella fentianensis]|uniref:hypothetical protein n=1 Tax=Duganella fentianensis TaxID=2692177 RepID=UPI0032B2D85F